MINQEKAIEHLFRKNPSFLKSSKRNNGSRNGNRGSNNQQYLSLNTYNLNQPREDELPLLRDFIVAGNMKKSASPASCSTVGTKLAESKTTPALLVPSAAGVSTSLMMSGTVSPSANAKGTSELFTEQEIN